MKNIFLTAIFFIYSLAVFAVETKGKLEINTERTNGAVVGESYPAVLTLVPFDKSLLQQEDLYGKEFIDYFYISRVNGIKVSENNSDAVVVYLDIVIAKMFKNKDFKLWSLGDRNIPITLDVGKVENTDRVTQKYITFETDLNEWKPSWPIIITLVLILCLGLGAYLYLRNKAKKHNPNAINLLKELRVTNNHKDFEWLYRNRKVLKESLKDRQKTIIAFDELSQMIEEYQFRKDWSRMDISELVAKKEKIMELYKDGV